MRNRMIPLLTLALCALLLLSSCSSASSEYEPKGDENLLLQSDRSEQDEEQELSETKTEAVSEEEPSQEVKKDLAKLTFDLGVKRYTAIDRFSKLSEAVREAKVYAASAGEDSLILTVTIAGGDIGKDEEYREIMRERESCDTVEEVRAFREKLNAYSKEYHERLFHENLNAFSVIEYSEITHVGYSPFVRLTVPVDKLTEESLLALAQSDALGVITVTVVEEAVDDGGTAIDE